MEIATSNAATEESRSVTVSEETPNTTVARSGELRFPLWSYFVVAIQGFLFLLILNGLFALRTVFRVDFWASDGWMAGMGWGVLTSLALLWGVVNFRWARLAARRIRAFDYAGHLAVVVCCAVATVGLHAVSAAKGTNPGLIVEDPAQLLSRQTPTAEFDESIFELEGNARKGRAWFSLYCVSCHGPDGNGVENLAPSLRESDFIASADRQALIRLIRFGRAIDDPLNKSGKPMPARGNNPDLADRHIVDIAEHLLSLYPESSSKAAAPSPQSTEKSNSDTGVLSTDSSPETSKDNQRESDRSKGSVSSVDKPSSSDFKPSSSDVWTRLQPMERNLTLVGLGKTTLWLHGGWVVAIALGTLAVIFSRAIGLSPRTRRGLHFSTSLGWTLATLTWFAIWATFAI
ncbi:MAG: cytochrome c [Pirellulaceae bacterium]|nr:cytochrome c [Pirellulaceae bacterium]